jgi:cyclin B
MEPASQEERIVAAGSLEEAERSNVQQVSEYAADIFSDLFRREAAFMPRADYMDSQVDITAKMRTILVDWLIEVHMKYRLRPETLHLTVNLVDRYLSRIPVMRKRLQLVGVVCMFIASKFEEIHPPELHDWVYITDNAYSKEDVLVMECNMLSTLSFQVMVPTAAHFFEGLQKVNGCCKVHREVAQYLLELGLLDIRMLQYRPSHVVSAALLLSNELMGRSSVWPASMVQHSRHVEGVLRGCVEELRQLHEADKAGGCGQLQAVHKKFSQPQHHSVATMSF